MSEPSPFPAIFYSLAPRRVPIGGWRCHAEVGAWLALFHTAPRAGRLLLCHAGPAAAAVGSAEPASKGRIAGARRRPASCRITDRAARAATVATLRGIGAVADLLRLGHAGPALSAIRGADPVAVGRVATTARRSTRVGIADRPAGATAVATLRRIGAAALGCSRVGHAGPALSAVRGADPVSRRRIATASRGPAHRRIALAPARTAVVTAERRIGPRALRCLVLGNAAPEPAVRAALPIAGRRIAAASRGVAGVRVAHHPARAGLGRAAPERRGIGILTLAAVLVVAFDAQRIVAASTGGEQGQRAEHEQKV